MAYLLGFDIHRYNNKVDPLVAKDAGINFALVRAGGIDYWGKVFEDDWFQYNSEVMPDHFPVGYWFVFRPNYDPQMQADAFLDLIRDKRQKLPPGFDDEIAGGVSAQTHTDRLLTSLALVDAEYPNFKNIIYTRAGFFNKYAAPDPRFALYDLWVARYTNQLKPWGNAGDSNYVVPRDWDTWAFWQWSADGNGRGQEFGAPPPPTADHDVDLDRFNGDLDAFNKYFNIAQGMPKIIEVISDKNTMLRDSIKGIPEHVMPKGTRLAVVDQEIANDGSTWYNVGGMWVLADHFKVIE